MELYINVNPSKNAHSKKMTARIFLCLFDAGF